MHDAPPALDLEHLSRLREMGASDASVALGRMFQRYLDSIPPQLTRMHEALEQNDAARLAREAHDLAGSSGVYGLPRLRHCCMALETCARQRTDAEALALLTAVERAYEEARPLVLAELPPRE
jgi:histidine phosphotransfer protein HptB